MRIELTSKQEAARATVPTLTGRRGLTSTTTTLSKSGGGDSCGSQNCWSRLPVAVLLTK